MDDYVTFLAGILRSVRFGAGDAHGKANMVRFNFFEEQGAFARDAGHRPLPRRCSTRCARRWMRCRRKLLDRPGRRRLRRGQAMTETMGVVAPQLQADLDRLKAAKIPVDVRFEQGLAVLGLQAAGALRQRTSASAAPPHAACAVHCGDASGPLMRTCRSLAALAAAAGREPRRRAAGRRSASPPPAPAPAARQPPRAAALARACAAPGHGQGRLRHRALRRRPAAHPRARRRRPSPSSTSSWPAARTSSSSRPRPTCSATATCACRARAHRPVQRGPGLRRARSAALRFAAPATSRSGPWIVTGDALRAERARAQRALRGAAATD